MTVDETRATPRRTYWLVLLAGFAIHAAASFFWMREGGFFDRPPSQDSAGMRIEAKALLERGAARGVIGIAAEAYRFDSYHPPLLPLMAALIAHGFSREVDGLTIWIPNVLFGLVFLCASGLLIGSVLLPGHRTLAAIIVVCAPGFIVYLRPSFAQMPMVALALLTAGLLLTSDWLERLSRVVLAGVVAALAFFTKNLAPIEIAGFCGAYLVFAALRRRMPARRILGRVAAFLAPIVLLDTAWYATHLPTILAYTREITGASGQVIWSEGIPLWSVHRWLALPWYFCRYCIGVPAAVAAAAVVVAVAASALRAKAIPSALSWRDGRGLVCLLIGGFVSYAVMTPGQVHPDAHFLIQWIPVYAVLLAPLCYALSSRAGGGLRAVLVVASAAMGLISYVPFHRSYPLWEAGGWTILEHYDSRKLAEHAWVSGCRPRPQVEKWPVDVLVSAAARWTAGAPARIGLLSANDHPSPYLLRTNIVFESWRQKVDVDLTELVLGGRSPQEAAREIGTYDVLCVDAKVGSAQDVAGVLSSQGVGLEMLHDLPVTDRWRYFVFGVRRPR